MLYMERPMTAQSLPRFALRAVGFSQWAYWCSLTGALLSLRYLPPGGARLLVMVTPALTAALCVAATYWLYEACDEYLRVRMLRAVTRTAVMVAAGTLAWFIFELYGAERISMLWVNLVGWSLFNLQVLLVILRSR
jgi:hypothetical protein